MGSPELSDVKGWQIEKDAFVRIVASERCDAIEKELGITSLPDQLFEGCYLKMSHKGKEVLSFSAVEALKAGRCTKEEAESLHLECSYSTEWKKKQCKTVHTGLHWTYDMLNYDGLVASDLESKAGGAIEMPLLMDTTQPILSFQACDLYEDDLEDCGTSKLMLKFRCMPTCWFILLRQFIRVDRVQVIIKDVRWFHKFGTNEVIKQRVTRGKDISDMAKAEDADAYVEGKSPALKLYNDPDRLGQTLPIQHEETTTYILP